MLLISSIYGFLLSINVLFIFLIKILFSDVLKRFELKSSFLMALLLISLISLFPNESLLISILGLSFFLIYLFWYILSIIFNEVCISFRSITFIFLLSIGIFLIFLNIFLFDSEISSLFFWVKVFLLINEFSGFDALTFKFIFLLSKIPILLFSFFKLLLIEGEDILSLSLSFLINSSSDSIIISLLVLLFTSFFSISSFISFISLISLFIIISFFLKILFFVSFWFSLISSCIFWISSFFKISSFILIFLLSIIGILITFLFSFEILSVSFNGLSLNRLPFSFSFSFSFSNLLLFISISLFSFSNINFFSPNIELLLILLLKSFSQFWKERIISFKSKILIFLLSIGK